MNQNHFGQTPTLAQELLADFGEDEDLEEEKDEEDRMSEEDTSERMEIDTVKYHRITELIQIQNDPRLLTLLQNIQISMKKKHETKLSQLDEDYDLIVQANNMSYEIFQEIQTIFKFVKERYSKKFPELESSVPNPLDYARVVQRIKNEDPSKVDLSDILPPATIMVVTMTATTITGTALNEEEMNIVQEACTLMLSLDESRKKIVSFVETKMVALAPNLTAIVGSSVAAKLMSIAGGLTSLSKIPASNIQILGANKKSLEGFAAASVKTNAGVIYECDIISKTPAAFRKRAIRLIAGKCTLAARVDAFDEDPTGFVGKKFRQEIEGKIEKWQEPPPAKLPKPLPAPDDKPKKRRGGKRMRQIKRKYEMTELRKQANRIPFGLSEQQTYGNTSKTLGMIGLEGVTGGKVRLSAVDKGILKKTKTKQTGISNKQSGIQTSGLSTSLAFTPAQGLELSNPEAASQKVKEANDKYFGKTSFSLKKEQTK